MISASKWLLSKNWVAILGVIWLVFPHDVVLSGDLNTGPIAHWAFEEGEGIVAYDSVGGNHGILLGSTSWVLDRFGGSALEFHGLGDCVSIIFSEGHQSPLNIYNTNVSISSWVKMENQSSGGTIVSRAQPHYITYMMTARSEEIVRANVYISPVHYQVDTGPVLTPGIWHHVVSVFDRDQDKVFIYVDGVQSTSGTLPDPPSNSGATKIGCRNGPDDIYTMDGGAIDDVQIYNRALSISDVRGLYKTGLTNDESTCFPLTTKEGGIAVFCF